MTGAARRWPLLALVGLLGACSDDGGGSARETTSGTLATATATSTTSSATTTTPGTTSTTVPPSTIPPSTLPPDPWSRLAPAGLSISVALDAAQRADIFRVGDELFITGVDAAGAPSVAYSNDVGASWRQQAVGAGSPNVFLAPEGPVLLFSERGSDQVIRTSRWDRQADGTWVMSTPEVPGLTSDQQVISGTTIYRHEGLGPIATLQDGSLIGFGPGGYAAPFDTGDGTPFLAQSTNGQEWTVTPMSGSSTLRPLDLLSGPAGPLLLAYDGAGDDRTVRIQRPVDAGEVLFSQIVGEKIGGAIALGGGDAYQVMLSEQRDGTMVNSLLRSTDGVTWDLQEISFDDITDVSTFAIDGGADGMTMIVGAIPSGETDHYPMLVTGRPGAWRTEVVDPLLRTDPIDVVQMADGSVVVLTSDSDVAVIAMRTPIVE
jgi:hypothetical protein